MISTESSDWKASPRNREQKRRARDRLVKPPRAQAPDNGPDHVFLVRAVEAVGRSIFADAWAPELADRPVPLRLPDWSDDLAERVNWQTRADAAETLRTVGPDGTTAADRLPEAFDDDDDWISDPRLWTVATATRNAEIAAITQATSQVARVHSDLLEKLRRGSVTTFSRLIAGGEYVRQPPSVWNYEGWKTRFVDGLIDPENPYETVEDLWGDGPDPGMHYLFVDRSELESAARIEGECPDLYRLWPTLNPLLQIALREAERIRTEGVEPVKDVVVVRLKELAEQYRVELKDSLAESIGTIVRSADAAKGGRPKKV